VIPCAAYRDLPDRGEHVRTVRVHTLAGASSFVSTMRYSRLVRPVHLERSLLESLPVGSLE